MPQSSTTELMDSDWRRLLHVMGAPARPRRWSDCFSPRFAHIANLRRAHALHKSGYGRLAKLFSLANYILFGLEVPARLEIGPGLILPHPNGVILGASRIGSNVTIYQQVTLGAKVADWGYNAAARPVIGDEVVITAGAKVLGPIAIGNGAIVGANAVVIHDVEAGQSVAGIPARPLGSRIDL